MKKTAFQAILMAFVFMMPMAFNTIVSLGIDCEKQVYFENCSEEGQPDKKESDSKEEKDVIETLIFHNYQFANSESSTVEYFSRSKALVSTSKDVLTQPPQFI